MIYMKTVLLVGGSGFIGLHLTKLFLDKGYKVVIVSTSKPKLDHENLLCYVADAKNLKFFDLFFVENKIDEAVYLINTIPPHGGDAVNLDVEVSINKAVLEVLFANVERVSFFSSGGRVYGYSEQVFSELSEPNPVCLYGQLKLALESVVIELAELFNKDYLIIRPSNPYGPGQNIYGNQGFIAIALGKILRGETVEVWNGGVDVRDYIYIDDFGAMFMNIFEYKGLPFNTYNIGSSVGVSTLEVLSYIRKVCNVDAFDVDVKPVTKMVSSIVLDISRYLKLFPATNIRGCEVGVLQFYEYLNN